MPQQPPVGEGGGERRGSHPRPPVAERRRAQEERGARAAPESTAAPPRPARQGAPSADPAECTAHDECGSARDAAHRRSGRQQEEAVEVARDDEQQCGNGDAESQAPSSSTVPAVMLVPTSCAPARRWWSATPRAPRALRRRAGCAGAVWSCRGGGRDRGAHDRGIRHVEAGLAAAGTARSPAVARPRAERCTASTPTARASRCRRCARRRRP